MDIPNSIKNKPRSKLTLDDCVFLTMRKASINKRWLSFWEMQEIIKNSTGRFFGEPTISASIRNMRKDYCREAYNLPINGEVIEKRRRKNSKGYEYKLILKEEVSYGQSI